MGRVAVIVEDEDGREDGGVEKKAERRKKINAGSLHVLRGKLRLLWKEGFNSTFRASTGQALDVRIMPG